MEKYIVPVEFKGIDKLSPTLENISKYTNKFNESITKMKLGNFTKASSAFQGMDLTTKKGSLSMRKFDTAVNKVLSQGNINKANKMVYALNEQNRAIKTASSGQRQFNMDLLSGMFFFMSFSMAMQSFLSPAQEGVGVWQLWRDYMTILFMPAAMWVLKAIMWIGQSLMNLSYDAEGNITVWGKWINGIVLAGAIVTKVLSIVFMTLLGFGGTGMIWAFITGGLTKVGLYLKSVGVIMGLVKTLFTTFYGALRLLPTLFVGIAKHFGKVVLRFLTGGNVIRTIFFNIGRVLGVLGSIFSIGFSFIKSVFGGFLSFAGRFVLRLLTIFFSPIGILILGLVAAISTFYLAVKYNIGGAGEFALKFRTQVFGMVRDVTKSLLSIPGIGKVLDLAGGQKVVDDMNRRMMVATKQLNLLEKSGRGSFGESFSSEYESLKGKFHGITGGVFGGGKTTTNDNREISININNDISSDVDSSKLISDIEDLIDTKISNEVR